MCVSQNPHETSVRQCHAIKMYASTFVAFKVPTSNLFGFSTIIHFTPVMIYMILRCFWSFTSTFNFTFIQFLVDL